MSCAFRLAPARGAALILALCTGCDRAPQGRSATSGAAPRELAFDRQAPGSANRVPALGGTPGRLGYRPGCLFLVVEAEDEIGLVLPAEVTFDGKRVTGRLPTPDGQPIAREIGQLMSFSGSVIANPGDGRYSCDTRRVLIADYF